MKKNIINLGIVGGLFFICVCSEAPLVQFPEPTDRVVLAELFTEDY